MRTATGPHLSSEGIVPGILANIALNFVITLEKIMSLPRVKRKSGPRIENVVKIHDGEKSYS